MFSLDLSRIPENLIQQEFVNQTNVRLNWPKYLFSVQAQLRNVETNVFEYSNDSNETSALFSNLKEASVYQLEFNISKPGFSSIHLAMNHSFQTSKHFSTSSENYFFFRFYKVDFERHCSII